MEVFATSNEAEIMNSLCKALLIAISSRVFIIIVSTLFTIIISNQHIDLLNMFVRADSAFYIGIAKNGYPHGVPAPGSIMSTNSGSPVPDVVAYPQWAFFPLYSVSIAIVGFLFTAFLPAQQSLIIGGYIVSNASFFAATILLYKITLKHLNQKVALISVTFFSFFVGGIFYSGVFSEALFLALSLGAFYFMEKDRLPAAILLGFLASFTKSVGFLIFIPFIILALQQLKQHNKMQALKLTIASIIVASPYLLWSIVGYYMTGLFPVQVIAHDSNWGIYPVLIDQFSNYYVSPVLTAPLEIFYITGLAIVLIPVAYFIIRIKTVFTVESKTLGYWIFYAILLYTTILTNATLFSTLRYAVPLFPIYWFLAKIYTKNTVVGKILFCITASMLIIGIYFFSINSNYMF
jgi:Gpi18-like mannosyltransferase